MDDFGELGEFFGFLSDLDKTRDARRVAYDEFKEFTVSTVFVPDRPWVFETAVICKGINKGEWIVVEGYDNVIKASEGHQKWIDKLKSTVPDTVYDIFEHVFYTRDI